MNVAIFTGPTISAEEARSELHAAYLPPVAQGDVYRVSLTKPQAIGIIDGYFERVPAVWHREILWAMAQGIHVFGSASMGALRAAELAAFGMEGVGAVFEAFHGGALEDDDEVAVAHGPQEIGYRGTSEAMVNIRFTLRTARQQGVISAQTERALIQIGKSLFYPERSYRRILECAAAERTGGDELATLQAWLPQNAVNQKRDDAVAMLRLMRSRLDAGLSLKTVDFKFERTAYWEYAIHRAGGVQTEGSTAPPLTNSDLVDEARLDGSYREMWQGAMNRLLSVREAERQNITVTAESLQELGDRFRAERGLHTMEEFQAWCAERGLTGEAFSRMLWEEGIRGLVEHRIGYEAMKRLPDQLHLSDRYDRLAQRVRDKERILAAAGLSNPGLSDTGLDEDKLMCWYFEERLERPVPANTAQYGRNLGFTTGRAFRQAIVREFCYIRLTGNEQTG